MSIGIYKITNKINNKVYIGQSIHIERRFKEHMQSAAHSPKSVIHTAINKYGIENFTFEIVELCLIEELDEKEVLYINKYNSAVPNGYNVQLGGNDNHLVIPEWVKELQDILVDKECTTPLIDLANSYNISRRTIYRINQGEVWKDENRSYPLREKPIPNHVGAWYCIDCGKEISAGSTRCVECMVKSQYTVERPDKSQLALEIVELGFEGVGRKYGVSGNAIKKWCVQYGLPKLKKDIIQWVQENL